MYEIIDISNNIIFIKGRWVFKLKSIINKDGIKFYWIINIEKTYRYKV